MQDPMEVGDGKYTYYLDDDDGLLNCDRHGEPWPAFRETGSHHEGCTLALYQALVEARAENDKLRHQALVAKVEWDRTITRLNSAVNAAENAATVIRGYYERTLNDRERERGSDEIW